MSLCQPVNLEYGRHVARLRRRRRRLRAYAPTSNTASHDNHEKSTHGFPFISHIWVAYGAPLGAPLSQTTHVQVINQKWSDVFKFVICETK